MPCSGAHTRLGQLREFPTFQEIPRGHAVNNLPAQKKKKNTGINWKIRVKENMQDKNQNK